MTICLFTFLWRIRWEVSKCQIIAIILNSLLCGPQSQSQSPTFYRREIICMDLSSLLEDMFMGRWVVDYNKEIFNETLSCPD